MSGRGAVVTALSRVRPSVCRVRGGDLSKENGRKTIISVAALPCLGDFIFVRMFSRKRLTDF
jgi:hypothetical protein